MPSATLAVPPESWCPNKTYHEMAEHYGTAVIPARVKHPKDKPNAEGTVGIISTWIIASLRHQQFFSLRELNIAIRLKLEEFNQKPFQKKPGSRKSAFLEEEKALLLPLPASPYELATWSTASVQYDYCIIADKNHYSVPYEYIRHQVDVRMTSKTVEVFYHFRLLPLLSWLWAAWVTRSVIHAMWSTCKVAHIAALSISLVMVTGLLRMEEGGFNCLFSFCLKNIVLLEVWGRAVCHWKWVR